MKRAKKRLVGYNGEVLNRLIISNFAIIENVDIRFKDGFTVLTGETGAGKSLVIDSLSLLLGARASSELIRSGEEKASVIGYFEIQNAYLEAELAKLNIPFEDHKIIVERTIGKTKNIIKINGVSVTLADLTRIAPFLADIHSQFDYAKILNPENYLSIIDGFANERISKFKSDYTSALENYKEKKANYLALLEKQKKLEENRDFLEYQYKELEGAELKENEDDNNENEISLLRNYDKIYSLTEEISALIDGDFMDRFYDLNKDLSKLASFQEQYKNVQEQLDEEYYSLLDQLQTLKKSFGRMDYDPARLSQLEERQIDLNELKRKYKKSINELIAYQEELHSLLNEGASFSTQIEEAKAEKVKAFKTALEKGNDLSLLRKRIAKSIEKDLVKSLKDLLLDVRFEIRFSPFGNDDSALLPNGIDNVDFYIETNIGEGLKPLSKVVSGGEASRLMLGFKALFIKANKVPTVIFDEIDTGISGESAKAVAKKIHEISLLSQVIAITHLPQVASMSDHSVLIQKEIRNGRTYSKMKELNLEEKIRQVAYLISGDEITPKQIEYAKEMVLGNRE